MVDAFDPGESLLEHKYEENEFLRPLNLRIISGENGPHKEDINFLPVKISVRTSTGVRKNNKYYPEYTDGMVFFQDWPLILLPVHVVFLELIIDPACSLIFEAEEAEPNLMNIPPRNPKERLFSLKSIALSLLQGASVLLIVLAWTKRACC